MPILTNANIQHAVSGFGVVDTEELFGSIKTHVADISNVGDFVDKYILGPADEDYTSDVWGKFKPWSTLVYIEDKRDLVACLSDDADLLLTIDSTSGLKADGNTAEDDKLFFKKDPATDPEGGFFVFSGNNGYNVGDTTVWDTSLVRKFVTSGNPVTSVALKHWVDMKTIFTDGLEFDQTTITEGTVGDGDSNTPSDRKFGGSLTGTVGAYTLTFPSAQDLIDATGALTASDELNKVVVQAIGGGTDQGKVRYSIDGAADITTSGDISMVNADFSGNLEVDGDATIGSIAATVSGVAGDSEDPLTTSYDANDKLTIESNVDFHRGVVDADVTAENALFLVADGGTLNSDDTPIATKFKLVQRQLASSAFSVPDVVDTITGTANEIVRSSETGNVTLSFADNLVLGGDSGTVTVGANGGHEPGITVYGNSTINGDLTVTGALVTTTSNEVTIEDAILSLGVFQETDGTNVTITDTDVDSLSGTVGIEAFHGATTNSQLNSGNQINDKAIHSRPYIAYQYGVGDALGSSATGNWGKWVIANKYTDPNPDTGGENDWADADSLNAWTAEQGFILSTLDVAVATNSDAHIIGSNVLTRVATPYSLLQPYSVAADGTASNIDYDAGSGQGYSRKFGRVAVNEVYYETDTDGRAEHNTVLTLEHGLGSDEVACFAFVTQVGGGSSLALGSMIYPKHEKGSDSNKRDVLVTGTVDNDKIKFVFIG